MRPVAVPGFVVIEGNQAAYFPILGPAADGIAHWLFAVVALHPLAAMAAAAGAVCIVLVLRRGFYNVPGAPAQSCPFVAAGLS